jgi:hypothetical protein
MDPTANLTEQRELADRLLAAAAGSENPRETAIEDSVRLAALVRALDEWRRSGGFDPYVGPIENPDRLEFGVCVDGAMPDPEAEHLHSDPLAAARQAMAIKSEYPDDLVTIVVWHAD